METRRVSEETTVLLYRLANASGHPKENRAYCHFIIEKPFERIPMNSFQNNPFKTIAVLLVLALVGTVADAQIKVTEPDQNPDDIEIIEMTVSAASQPDPVFKHRLTFLPYETTSGNAATIYLAGLAEYSLEKMFRDLEKKYGEEAYEWSYLDTPTEEIPLDKLKLTSAEFDPFIKEFIAQATRKRSCDWGLNMEDKTGPWFLEMNLSWMQDTRTISRTLAIQTRLAIIESRFDDAIDLMRMNYRLAENVGREKVLVGTLIAIAETSITNGSMTHFIAAPDSPNMYWALTELPRPMVDLRGAIRLECANGLRIVPELASADTEEHSIEEWSRIAREIPVSLMEYTYQATESEIIGLRFIPLGFGIMSYGLAKQRLIESGMDPEKVEAMAVGQVLLIDAKQEYLRVANLMEKEIYLPFPSSDERSDKIEDLMFSNQSQMTGGFGQIFAGLLLPALQQIRAAQIRTDRDIDALRVIEALRMHAAETGKFPTKLSDISVVPVPVNPATGKPFEYRLDGETAVVELPRSDGPIYSKRYRISLR